MRNPNLTDYTLYWYDTALEIWGNLIAGLMRVTSSTILWKWRLRGYEDLQNYMACHEESYWLKNVSTIFIITYIYIYIQGYSYLTRNGCFLRFPQIRDINEASKGSDFNQLGFRQPMKIWEKYQHILYNKGIMKISLCNL